MPDLSSTILVPPTAKVDWLLSRSATIAEELLSPVPAVVITEDDIERPPPPPPPVIRAPTPPQTREDSIVAQPWMLGSHFSPQYKPPSSAQENSISKSLVPPPPSLAAIFKRKKP